MEAEDFRDSDLLCHLFETVVALCMFEGLVSGQRFATDANKQNSTAKEDWDRSAIDPDAAPHAVREYPDVLDDAAFGAETAVEPKFISHSELSSQWTVARKGPAIFAYSMNYLIDTDHVVIVDVEATQFISLSLIRSGAQMASGPVRTLNGILRTTNTSARRGRR